MSDDIVEILERTSDALLTTGQDYSDVLLGAAADTERLRGLVYYVSPSEFAPDGITWKQEAERLLDLLASEQELRLGPKPLSKKDYFENLLQHGVVP